MLHQLYNIIKAIYGGMISILSTQREHGDICFAEFFFHPNEGMLILKVSTLELLCGMNYKFIFLRRNFFLRVIFVACFGLLYTYGDCVRS